MEKVNSLTIKQEKLREVDGKMINIPFFYPVTVIRNDKSGFYYLLLLTLFNCDVIHVRIENTFSLILWKYIISQIVHAILLMIMQR